ncbi:MAG: B12-binding domain-containing radical SAM protein [Candidatus Omnitrophica bacterium]|nr:B12-binding domain-containing radical SAM protein [Candidatus Omnitrophota bacterium]
MGPKVLLIDPRGWQGAVSGNRAFPNVGIAYLASSLKSHGCQVSVIDLNNTLKTDGQVLSEILQFQPDIIGFSSKTATIKDSRNIANQLKDFKNTFTVVVGGAHTASSWQSLIREGCFDAVFVGEGEEGFAQACLKIKSKESLEGIEGLITKNPQGKDISVSCALIQDLDLIRFPDYDDFPEIVKRAISATYPLVTSRGCVYKCTYCSVPEISGKKFRPRSPQNIIDELEYARTKYGIRSFEIIDDVFNLDIERCKEICRQLLKADLGLNWSCPNGLRADRVDKELAQLMYQSGCRSVMVGIESADPKILESVKKAESLKDIEKGIITFQDAGINVGGYFIIGLPGDSFRSVERSARFARRLKIPALFNMLVPYPGTELWEWAMANARFLYDIEDGLHFADLSQKVKPVIETDDFSGKERQRAYEMAHTLTGNFNMLVPPQITHWRRDLRILSFLFKFAPIDAFLFLGSLLKQGIKKTLGKK